MVAFMNAFSEGMSGGDACFIEVARRLHGWRIAVVTSELGRRACVERGLRAEFWVTTSERTFGRTVRTYLARTALALALIRRVRPGDVVHASSDFLPDVLPAALARVSIPRVTWSQHVFHLIPARRRISHHAQRLSHAVIRRWADLVVADSRLVREALVRRGFRAARVQVNHPGIDLARFRASGGPEAKAFDGVFLGRVHRSKGVFDLIEIWRGVCRERPAARLALVGHGDAATVAQLRRRIAAAGLDHNIRVFGFLDHPEAVATLRRSRVLVFPSREEGFGMAILEALAVDVPAVVWDLPVYREVFPAGLVRVPVGEIDAFAAAVLGLLDDEAGRRALVTESRPVVARYDWERIAAREAELLEAARARDLAAGEPPPPA